ncbi:ComF family protein [Pseudomonas gingeri]|uniref:ComF family protein n=1 Tax=Pseudomonas gingeri TaxID=117681 RepID=UPI0015A497AE|nr:ComF family protein [Pseudomonas gingeri]NWE26325.1 ComF family protein [Pseudomonas gingeri]NWE98521.1 ComF family protein [Pseudomonas gingeri]
MDCQPHNKSQVYIWLKNKQFCLLCDEPADSTYPLCTPCESELPWLLDYCQTCALPLPMSGLTCGHCLKRPPGFEQVIAPWIYRFPVDSLITRFKHQSQWPLGRLLAELLVQALRERFDSGLPRPDLLLPVPLATKRQRQRGYNQAAMLMNWLGQSLEIPVDEHRLRRIQDTVAQQELDARARRRNLLNAFALVPGAQVEGLHLALVDDVLTTGATAESVARLLLKAGARRVDVYCLARTPAPQSR